jgi:hypothetical protein
MPDLELEIRIHCHCILRFIRQRSKKRPTMLTIEKAKNNGNRTRKTFKCFYDGVPIVVEDKACHRLNRLIIGGRPHEERDPGDVAWIHVFVCGSSMQYP